MKMKVLKTKIFLFVLISFQISAFAAKKADLTGTMYCRNKEMTGVRLLNSSNELVNQADLKADRIVVQKEYKKLYLMSQGFIIKSYDIAMGPGASLGPKAFEGDNKTPEGMYNVEFKNPNSKYYMALKVSYPNARDTSYALSQKRSAGGYIMIHGFPVAEQDGLIPEIVKNNLHPRVNWTQGCMAVTDREIEEIYSLVQEKVAIEICPVY
jgi:murein L,D-transpeptidase YafK